MKPDQRTIDLLKLGRFPIPLEWMPESEKKIRAKKSKDRVRATDRKYVSEGGAINSGCEICGEPAEIHHKDYSNNHNIQFLCRKHHAQIHSGKLTVCPHCQKAF